MDARPNRIREHGTPADPLGCGDLLERGELAPGDERAVELKNKLGEGRYAVDPRAVADEIIEELLLLRKAKRRLEAERPDRGSSERGDARPGTGRFSRASERSSGGELPTPALFA